MEFFAGLVRLAVVGTICIGIGDLILYAIVKIRDKKRKIPSDKIVAEVTDDTKK